MANPHFTNPNMMNAKGPRLESCLYGPSCKPISVKPYTSIRHDQNTANTGVTVDDANEVDNSQIATPEKKDGSQSTLVDVANETTASASASASTAVDGVADEGPKLESPVDANITPLLQDNAVTPPQSPHRPTPLRPSKSMSSSKSSKTSTSTPPATQEGSTTHKKKGSETGTKAHTINLSELRRLSSQGVPDDCTLRPLAWRVLLGYLPLDTSKWQSYMYRDRALYRNLVNELFVASEDHPFEEEGKHLRGNGVKKDGKSIRASPHNRVGKESPDRVNEAVEALSKTNLLDEAEEKHAMEQHAKKEALEIPEDVREQWRRTGRDPESLVAAMGGKRSKSSLLSRHFNALLVTNNETATTETNDEKEAEKSDGALYLTESMKDVIIDRKWRNFLDNASLLDEIRKDVERTHPDLQFFLEPRDHLGLRRYAAIERILFVWAKLNKGVRYVQGMNEIAGTLYFVLANDQNEEWSTEAEADTYFLFNTLMVGERDIFVPELDEADTGIQGRMANMLDLLSLHDPEVRCHLDDAGIDPGFYSIRWLTTFLSREFLLPDTIRLWDSMFASTHKDNFLRYVCVCMVMIIRESLLKSDFGGCLKLLQAYPTTDVDKLLESSRSLWIYESQVTLACHKGGISLNQALTTIAPPDAVIMAYGLRGGLALEQIERKRNEFMEAAKNANKRNKSRNPGKTLTISINNNAPSKSFFGGFFNNKK